jgi:hopanoid biosynthesis associated RND transporter like protein HpnN
VGSWVGRLLAAVVRASIWRPWVTVVLSTLLALGAGLYTFSTLDFVTSALRLLPQRARYVVLLNQYLQDFSELDDIIVAVEAPSPTQAKQYADRLVRTLRRDGLQTRITYRVDPSFFDRRGLLYLAVDDLIRLRDRLFDYDEFIRSYAARPTLVRLLEGLNQQFANAMALGFLDLGIGESGVADLRFVDAVVDQILARLEGTTLYVSPWDRAFSLGSLDEPDAGYYFSSDKRLLFLFVAEQLDEGNFASNRERIGAIRRAIGKLGSEFPDVRAGVTGGPTIADDEMGTAVRDSALATGLAGVLTLALLLLAYRRLGTPLLLLATLAASLLWSLGINTLLIGHLSVFSVMFLSLVIGVGIDYGIYFLYRFQEEWALDAPITEAMRRTADRTGPGILLGALTAAGTFFVLILTDFQGIREFGFVSGVSILMAFFSMLTLLPALLVLAGRRRRGFVPARSSLSLPDRSESRWLIRLTTYRKTILIVAGALSAVGMWGVLDVTFDHNMLKLQAAGIESVVWEERILASSGRSGFTALSTAGSLDELRRKQDAFSSLPSVSDVESVLMLVPDKQLEKERIIRQFAPLVAGVQVAAPLALEPAALRAPLLVLRRRLALAGESIADERMRANVQRLREKVERTVAALGGARPDTFGSLGRLQGQLHDDFVDKLERFKKSLDPQPVRAGDAPPELRERYIGRSGRYLLRIHPAVDIWQEAGARRFIEDLRRVDPDVTGPPVTKFEATHLIERGYFQGTPYALVLVAAITFAVLRTVRGTALSLAPVVLGVLWTLGVMRVLGLEFNLANVWALPLIIGTAAEYGLNIYVRFREGIEGGGPRFPESVILGVILSWLTTIAGFGSLMVAHHHGIFTLGLLLSVGSTASLGGALFVLPVLIGLFVKPPMANGRQSLVGSER